jgi:hypothetical protein
MCDLENLKNEEAMTGVGSQRHSKKGSKKNIYVGIVLNKFQIIQIIFSEEMEPE